METFTICIWYRPRRAARPSSRSQATTFYAGRRTGAFFVDHPDTSLLGDLQDRWPTGRCPQSWGCLSNIHKNFEDPAAVLQMLQEHLSTQVSIMRKVRILRRRPPPRCVSRRSLQDAGCHFVQDGSRDHEQVRTAPGPRARPDPTRRAARPRLVRAGGSLRPTRNRDANGTAARSANPSGNRRPRCCRPLSAPLLPAGPTLIRSPSSSTFRRVRPSARAASAATRRLSARAASSCRAATTRSTS